MLGASNRRRPALTTLSHCHGPGHDRVHRRHRQGNRPPALAANSLLFTVGMTPDAASGCAVRAVVDAVQTRMAPWSTGRAT